MSSIAKKQFLWRDSRYGAWLKKAGIGGFLFFFLKGMAWLALIWWVAP